LTSAITAHVQQTLPLSSILTGEFGVDMKQKQSLQHPVRDL